MFLTKVAPLSKIPRPAPQFLTYFTSKKLKRGALVLVPLRKKKVKAIVFNQKKVIDLKLAIKEAEYKIKPIIKVLEKEPIIKEIQIELAKWIADYYWASFGKVLSLFVRSSKEKKEKSIKKENSFLEKLIIAPNNFFPKKEIENAILAKKEILFLVPEKEKEKYWKKELKIFNYENLIIGTRSKLFLPFSNLGLIVLTEEGNKNYKSPMEPRYQTKEVARKLAEIWKAKLIIVSSFPSIESYYTIKNKKTLEKNTNKVQKEIIDMKKIKPWQPISNKLLLAIKEKIKNNQKVLLFIHRTGSATTLLCQDCGWIKKCDNCDVPLTYHLEKDNIKLICHYCAKEYEVPRLCQNCKSWNLKTLGVGIQKIEKELKEIFGKDKIFRLDSKITKTKGEQEEIIKKFLTSDSSILLTTSLFLKFPIFEKFSLVGVISLDSLLCQPDFKIEEEVARKINTLLSFAGEKFILQTFFPELKAISWIKKDKEFFYKKTIEERKKFNYPPFSKIIKLSISDKKRERIIKEGFNLKEKIQLTAQKYKIKKINILGPSPAFIEKIKGKYQWKIIIKLKDIDKNLKTILLANIPPKWVVDVDPEKII